MSILLNNPDPKTWLFDFNVSNVSNEIKGTELIITIRNCLNIRDYEKIGFSILEGNEDPDIEKITLNIRSWGGEAIGIQQSIEAIENSKKPTTAIIDGYATSGGYWLACACDKVLATDKTCKIGSIGAIAVYEDYTKYFEKNGIKHTVLRDGKKKATGNFFEELTEEQKKEKEAEVIKIATDFRNYVISKRKLNQDWNDESIVYDAESCPFLIDGYFSKFNQKGAEDMESKKENMEEKEVKSEEVKTQVEESKEEAKNDTVVSAEILKLVKENPEHGGLILDENEKGTSIDNINLKIAKKIAEISSNQAEIKGVVLDIGDDNPQSSEDNNKAAAKKIVKILAGEHKSKSII